MKWKLLLVLVILGLIAWKIHNNCDSCQQKFADMKTKFFGMGSSAA